MDLLRIAHNDPDALNGVDDTTIPASEDLSRDEYPSHHGSLLRARRRRLLSECYPEVERELLIKFLSRTIGHRMTVVDFVD